MGTQYLSYLSRQTYNCLYTVQCTVSCAMCSFPLLGVGDYSLHLCQEVPLLHSHLHLSSHGGHGGCQPHDVRVCVVQCLYVCTVHGGGWRRAAQPHGWTPPALLGVPLLQHLFHWCVCVFVHVLCTCVSVNAESATIIAVGHSDDVVLLNCAVGLCSTCQTLYCHYQAL